MNTKTIVEGTNSLAVQQVSAPPPPGPQDIKARILKAHSHSMSGGSI